MKPEEFAQFVLTTRAEIDRLEAKVAKLRKEAAGYRVKLAALKAGR